MEGYRRRIIISQIKCRYMMPLEMNDAGYRPRPCRFLAGEERAFADWVQEQATTVNIVVRLVPRLMHRDERHPKAPPPPDAAADNADDDAAADDDDNAGAAPQHA
jgi:hypothetical protein